MTYVKTAQQNIPGVIVASGWKAKGNTIRMVFQNSITDPKGKRIPLADGVKFSPNETLLVAPVKNKRSDRSPDYVGICFPDAEVSAVPEKK